MAIGELWGKNERRWHEEVDLCTIHGRFIRPMTATEWKRHVERKHSEAGLEVVNGQRSA